jgi:Arc/MetJ-type ribon-helix-helix transcriptional regulator
MAIQLSPEQESRIQALVEKGFRDSPEKVLDHLLRCAELEEIGFEGTPGEFDALMLEGLDSGEGEEINDDFWNRVEAETDRMAAEHAARKLTREA